MYEQNLKTWIEAAEKADYKPDRLAKELSICRKQLERWTKLRFGKTPQSWLDEQRLYRATKLLEQNKPIKDVAHKLGFKQLSHFSRKFKLYNGLPPRDFVLWLKTGQPLSHTLSRIGPAEANALPGR